MRQGPKEILYDKSRKMIDLIYDEVCDTGEKSLETVFVNQKSHLRYKLTVGVEVVDPKKAIEANDDTPTEENPNNTQEQNTEDDTQQQNAETTGAENND